MQGPAWATTPGRTRSPAPCVGGTPGLAAATGSGLPGAGGGSESVSRAQHKLRSTFR